MKDLSNDILLNLFGQPKVTKLSNEEEEKKGFQAGAAYVVGMTKKQYIAECSRRSNFSQGFWA